MRQGAMFAFFHCSICGQRIGPGLDNGLFELEEDQPRDIRVGLVE